MFRLTYRLDPLVSLRGRVVYGVEYKNVHNLCNRGRCYHKVYIYEEDEQLSVSVSPVVLTSICEPCGGGREADDGSGCSSSSGGFWTEEFDEESRIRDI